MRRTGSLFLSVFVLCLLTVSTAFAAGISRIDKLLASDGGSSDAFGSTVASDGNRIVVGVPDFNGGIHADSGQVYIFERLSGAWAEVARIAPSGLGAFDNFGKGVALDGNRLAVGAPGHHDFNGAVWIYERDGGVWKPTAKLQVAAESSDFGWAVDLRGDRLAVGAICDRTMGFCAGAAYVFELEGGIWMETARLLASDGRGADNLGSNLALGSERLAVSSIGAGDGQFQTGAVYVFEHVGGLWTETAKITPAAPTGQDFFGDSIVLEGDRLAVGATLDDDRGNNAGAIYVYSHTAGLWRPTAKLTPGALAAGDNFGVSVALDGALLAGGAFGADTPAGDSGAVWIFHWDGLAWRQMARVNGDGQGGDLFGISAFLDRGRLVAGASRDDENGQDAGAVWVYELWNNPPVTTTPIGH